MVGTTTIDKGDILSPISRNSQRMGIKTAIQTLQNTNWEKLEDTLDELHMKRQRNDCKLKIENDKPNSYKIATLDNATKNKLYYKVQDKENTEE